MDPMMSCENTLYLCLDSWCMASTMFANKKFGFAQIAKRKFISNNTFCIIIVNEHGHYLAEIA